MEKRMSVSLEEDIVTKIVELRKTDEYCNCSYGEIIRMLLRKALADEAESA